MDSTTSSSRKGRGNKSKDSHSRSHAGKNSRSMNSSRRGEGNGEQGHLPVVTIQGPAGPMIVTPKPLSFNPTMVMGGGTSTIGSAWRVR